MKGLIALPDDVLWLIFKHYLRWTPPLSYLPYSYLMYNPDVASYYCKSYGDDLNHTLSLLSSIHSRIRHMLKKRCIWFYDRDCDKQWDFKQGSW